MVNCMFEMKKIGGFINREKLRKGKKNFDPAAQKINTLVCFVSDVLKTSGADKNMLLNYFTDISKDDFPSRYYNF